MEENKERNKRGEGNTEISITKESNKCQSL